MIKTFVTLCIRQSSRGLKDKVPFSTSPVLLFCADNNDKKQRRVDMDTRNNQRDSSSGGSGSDEEEDTFQTIKNAFLNMPIEDKRKIYKCGKDGYVKLSQVPTWPQYWEQEKPKGPSYGNAEEVRQALESRPAVDTELNEKISIWKGDITKLEIDAIVNAANSRLLGGGGVDGAIHRAAGPDLLTECRTLKGCAQGGAKITGGYKLPAKHIIHTVGPMEELPDVLFNCYKNTFKRMLENNLRTIAFPCIGTGIYGFPNAAAAEIAISTTRQFLEKHKDKVDRIVFVTFMPVDVKIYGAFLQHYFPLEEKEGAESPESNQKGSQEKMDVGDDKQEGKGSPEKGGDNKQDSSSPEKSGENGNKQNESPEKVGSQSSTSETSTQEEQSSSSSAPPPKILDVSRD